MMNRTQGKPTIARRTQSTAPRRGSGARRSGEELSVVEDTRAVRNVAEWQKFLPKECVDLMIKDGWHHTV
jgi:hypothetical protein